MRTLATLTACVLFSVSALAAGPFQEIQNDAVRESVEHVHNLFEEISTINLLNGLNLTQEQMIQVLAAAKQARAARQEALESDETLKLLKDTEAAYQALRAEVQKGAPARGSVPFRAVRLEHQLKALQDQHSKKITKTLQTLEKELETVLTPEQVQVVNTFKACLIPPKDLKSPVRAGQASSNEHAVRTLRNIRKIPDKIWNEKRETFIDRHLEMFTRHRYRMTDAEQEKEKKRLLELADKVRTMSDFDFELEKETLAEELEPADKMDALRKEIESRLPYQRRPTCGRLGQYLLSAKTIRILEERLGAAEASAEASAK